MPTLAWVRSSPRSRPCCCSTSRPSAVGSPRRRCGRRCCGRPPGPRWPSPSPACWRRSRRRARRRVPDRLPDREVARRSTTSSSSRVLFAYFGVPAASQRRVLFWGIAGAIVLRAIFIFAGAALLDAFHCDDLRLRRPSSSSPGSTWPGTASDESTRAEPGDEAARRALPMRPLRRRALPGPREAGAASRRHCWPRWSVAAFDVLFAVDSVPAIFAVSRDTFVVFAANAFSAARPDQPVLRARAGCSTASTCSATASRPSSSSSAPRCC